MYYITILRFCNFIKSKKVRLKSSLRKKFFERFKRDNLISFIETTKNKIEEGHDGDYKKWLLGGTWIESKKNFTYFKLSIVTQYIYIFKIYLST